MPRILAVDWGERRIGVAVSDPTALIAQPRPTLEVRSEDDAVRALTRQIEAEEADLVVVGLPLNMDGSHGPAALAAEHLAERLAAATGRPVEMWDERLTSAEALRQAQHLGEKTRGRKRKGRIDARAAELLLQSYLDARGPRSSGGGGR
jgi:putative Holliday junction resolvase